MAPPLPKSTANTDEGRNGGLYSSFFEFATTSFAFFFTYCSEQCNSPEKCTIMYNVTTVFIYKIEAIQKRNQRDIFTGKVATFAFGKENQQ